jgi:DNA-binding NtrC family response regulator
VENRELPPRQFTTGALNALRVYDWPGNLAELENVVRSTALLALTSEIGATEVNNAVSRQDAPLGRALGTLPLDLALRQARDAFERVYFDYHISRESGNMSRVAERVGLERTHLYRKLKQLGIKLPRRD